jgi:PhoPQ-activated pathogenicity-related protein
LLRTPAGTYDEGTSFAPLKRGSPRVPARVAPAARHWIQGRNLVKTRFKFSICLALLILGGRSISAAEKGESSQPGQGPLHSYVKQPDASNRWVKRQEGKVGKATWAELILTSQTWKDTVWKHQLFVIRPSEVENEAQGIMLIDGGAWSDDLAKPAADDKGGKLPSEAAILAQVAERVKSPVAVLKQVPNQPIFDGLTEDGAISYTFEQYINTGDSSWPLLLPMVKSAVRGMDAVQEFAKQEWSLDIKNFTLTGASKRGWTTWLTASVDPRVNAFAPMVIDMLNMGVQMKHQVATFGEFSEQIQDYTNRGIQQQNDSDVGRMLQAIVDPYAYRALLTQPKVILLGTNDRYWPLDALNLYWNGLAGEKHILYVPNNGHGLNDFTRIIGTVSALHRQAAGGKHLAKLTWELTDNDERATLNIKADTKPDKVSAWVATAATRDFRESKWTSHPTELVEGAYQYKLERPKSGYAAVFGEAVFDTDHQPYFLSTNVKLVKAKDAADDTAK